jgi:choline dehydrogenase-like flavoprotein
VRWDAVLILDLEKNSPIEVGGYEVCVIGAGAAGIVLALALARRGLKTLLLEAGGRGYEARTQDLYFGDVAGRDYKGLYDGRFRVLGGTTTQWGGQILEIDDFVFDRRPWISGSGWPFPKRELQPFYDEAQTWEGLQQSPKRAEEVWQKLGLENPDFGPALISELSRWCPFTNFARVYADELAQSKSLTTVLHANVCEFQLSDDETTIEAARCRTLRGHQLSFHANRFVLCMGAIESCRLLLHPAAGGAAPPWNRQGLVGKHYQDHVSCVAADVLIRDPVRAQTYFDYVSISGFRFQPKLKLSRAEQEALQTLDVCGFMLFSSGENDDLALAFETYRLLKTKRFKKLSARRLAHFVKHFHKLAWHRLPYSRSFSAKTDTCKLCVNSEQLPLAEGCVDLSAEVDALGLRRPRVRWKMSELELYSIRRYVGVIAEVFDNKGWGQIVPQAYLFSDDALMSDRFEDIYHHMGGTRMGLEAANSVVDPSLKIHGTRNAYVCSTSVFPCAGFVNPTHTLIALALRLAHHLINTPATPDRMGQDKQWA